MCEAFGCTPDVAKRQDLNEVRAIFEYRNAKAGRDLFRTKEGRAQLAKQPEVMELLLGILRAQIGEGMTMKDLGEVLMKDEDEAEDGS